MLRDSMKGTSVRADIMEVSKRPISWAIIPLTIVHLAKQHSFLCTVDVLSVRAKMHRAIKDSIILTAYWNFSPGISPTMASSIFYQEICWPLVYV